MRAEREVIGFEAVSQKNVVSVVYIMEENDDALQWVLQLMVDFPEAVIREITKKHVRAIFRETPRKKKEDK